MPLLQQQHKEKLQRGGELGSSGTSLSHSSAALYSQAGTYSMQQLQPPAQQPMAPAAAAPPQPMVQQPAPAMAVPQQQPVMPQAVVSPFQAPGG